MIFKTQGRDCATLRFFSAHYAALRACYRTASLRDFPALKAGRVIAGILIFCVGLRGFTPMREARFETRKVPKPVRVTEFPLERLLVTASRTASRASVAAFFVMPALCAAMLIRSPFVMAMALMDKSRLIIGGSGLRARKKI